MDKFPAWRVVEIPALPNGKLKIAGDCPRSHIAGRPPCCGRIGSALIFT